MGNLIVDAQVKKDVTILEINQETQEIHFCGKGFQFKRELEFLGKLKKYRKDGIYPHLIVNYHNTYTYMEDNIKSVFTGCLPLTIYKKGRNTILKMLFNKKEKVDQEYLDFYTKEFDKEIKNGRK